MENQIEFLLAMVSVLGTVIFTVRLLIAQSMQQQRELVRMLASALERLAAGHDKLAHELRQVQQSSAEAAALVRESLTILLRLELDLERQHKGTIKQGDENASD